MGDDRPPRAPDPHRPAPPASGQPASLRRSVIAGLTELLNSLAPVSLPSVVAQLVEALDAGGLDLVDRALQQVQDLEDRTVRDVLGRDGKVVPIHHFRASRAEDSEASWDFRPPSRVIRRFRDVLLTHLLPGEGLGADGVEGLVEAADAGKRFLFISNHESVFDLAVLPHALTAGGLRAVAERLTFFVNPKIFNTPFTNFFICKPVGLLKVPQNPRIAANESVMAAEEVQRRAGAGFSSASARLAAGDSLVIYPEGLRSDGVLHRFARAYLDLIRPDALSAAGLAAADVLLVPWAHRGVRGLEDLAPGTAGVTLRFGRPVTPEAFFDTLGSAPTGVAAHLAAFLVARLLPEDQRGLYGADAAAYLDHPHYRQRVREHTAAHIRMAQELAQKL